MAAKLTLTVSQLNEYIRRMLQLDPMLHGVALRGEISNLKFHQSGTIFFTLKDELSAIACVMYASDTANLQVTPFEGMRAVVSGSAGLYVRGGQMQFYANDLRAEGVGVLYERLLALKDRLAKEGLFERKRSLPPYPDTIGVVTSPTGAVIHDIMHVAFRRDPQARMLLCPVRVQGAGAAQEVVQAIELLSRMDGVSVIIVARGGGSMEDLWTFNEECVGRAVAACTTPIVSAVGHETDVTLCDLAADLRAPTPSAAAECVTPLRTQTMDKLAQLRRALDDAAVRRIARREAALHAAAAALAARRPQARLEAEAKRLAQLGVQLRRAAQGQMGRHETRLAQRGRELYMLSPYRVLARGYAIVSRAAKPVVSAAQLAAGDAVTIRFADGTAQARIAANTTGED